MNLNRPRAWLRFYDKGVPYDIEVPEATIYEKYVETADKCAEKTALIFLGKRLLTQNCPIW